METMKEFFSSSGELVGKMYLGDCLEILPRIKNDIDIEVAIFSPPYNLINGVGSRRIKEQYSKWYYDTLEEPIYQEEQKRLISLLVKITKSSIFYNHKIRYAWHPRNKHSGAARIYHPMMWLQDFPIWTEIIWDRKTKNQPIPKKYPICDERIYQIKKPNKWKDYGWSNIWRINPSKNQGHVCTYPAELVERCMLPTTEENDFVLDPYMGSGTTAITALKHNRRFIGIERNEEYFDLCCMNIQKEIDKYQQIRMF